MTIVWSPCGPSGRSILKLLCDGVRDSSWRGIDVEDLRWLLDLLAAQLTDLMLDLSQLLLSSVDLRRMATDGGRLATDGGHIRDSLDVISGRRRIGGVGRSDGDDGGNGSNLLRTLRPSYPSSPYACARSGLHLPRLPHRHRPTSSTS
jgi:hypothetical protein